MLPAGLAESAAAALGFGVMHALTPCAHSWPVLLPLSVRARSAARPGLLFGAGMLVSSIAVGAVIGAFGDAIFHEAHEHVEEAVGVLVALLGLALIVRPGWMHGGHLHGKCATDPGGPAGAEHCEHATHQPLRFLRFGNEVGAFLLGVTNMAVPCWSNVAGIGLAVEAGSAKEGALTLGLYGLSAGVTTLALLVLIHHGLKLTERLRSPRFETAMLRLAGLLMLAYGVTLVFHVGHTH
jgi:sulfite exporter TauE/SafE